MRALITYLILWPSFATANAQPESQKHSIDPWSAGPPANPKQPQTWNFVGRRTGGIVLKLDDEGVTIHRLAGEVLHWRHDPVTGESFGIQKTEVITAWPEKKFAYGDQLAKGAYVKTASACDTYRSSDIRVGDWITIEYDRKNGVDVCTTISIHRRPGGQIPPAPGEQPTEFRKYHEQANADQDWEYNRSPYPRKYWPSYRGSDGKLYLGPYPQESIQFIAKLPTAPAPREVKPTNKMLNP